MKPTQEGSVRGDFAGSILENLDRATHSNQILREHAVLVGGGLVWDHLAQAKGSSWGPRCPPGSAPKSGRNFGWSQPFEVPVTAAWALKVSVFGLV